MSSNLAPQPDFRVPLPHRGAAFAIDFLVVGLISSLLSGGWVTQGIVFLVGWFLMRLVLVSRNHGQSLGRWALDMRVIDARRGGTPALRDLTRREGMLGFESFLAWMGMVSFSPINAWAFLLLLPLIGDCLLAMLNPERTQALHDQIAQTWVVRTRRGYSLDRKLKKLVVDLRQYVKK